mmetsp:Transcript_146498/g.365323  ORF Transcript_146498/g.365323 Transcript_146498/m.365323 type:complete len:434 (+) Transcript_146498:107-1408(+)
MPQGRRSAGVGLAPAAAAAAGGDDAFRRLALVLANGAYTQRAPLSRPVGVAAELCQKLEAMGFEVFSADNQDLAGMRSAALRWIRAVEEAANDAEEQALRSQEGLCPRPGTLLLFFTFCGHGSAGRFFPVDCPRGAPPQASFDFFEDLLYKLYAALGGCDDCGRKWPHWKAPSDRGPFPGLGGVSSEPLNSEPLQLWKAPGSARLIVVIESCRRLSKEEQKAFDEEKARVANGKRHLLPSVVAMRPDLAALGGADWDASRLSFLSRLGLAAPQLLLALSSESTTPSYDVVFLRSITEAIDRPVRLGGILERAGLDTMRRTGHKQKPVLLALGCAAQPGCHGASRQPALQDMVLAQTPAVSATGGPPSSAPATSGLRRSSSSAAIPDAASAADAASLLGCPEPRTSSAPARRPRRGHRPAVAATTRSSLPALLP